MSARGQAACFSTSSVWTERFRESMHDSLNPAARFSTPSVAVVVSRRSSQTAPRVRSSDGPRGALILPPENPRGLLEGVPKVGADVALVETMVANRARHGAIHDDRSQTRKRAERFIASVPSWHAASVTEARVV